MAEKVMTPPHATSLKLFRYRMTVAYDGSHYTGWQVQPVHMTVQQRLEEVLASLSGETVKVHGSGGPTRVSMPRVRLLILTC